MTLEARAIFADPVMVRPDQRVRIAQTLAPMLGLNQGQILKSLDGASGSRFVVLKGALARLERHYLSHPVAGGWYDQFDRDGNSLVATIPASSFYHVLCAVAEAEQVLG